LCGRFAQNQHVISRRREASVALVRFGAGFDEMDTNV